MLSQTTAYTCSIILFSSIIAASPDSSATAQQPVCKIAGLSASVPHKAGLVTQNFLMGLQNRTLQTSPALRCALLHGRPGVGKTVLAHTIASATNSELVTLKASGLVNAYQGSGASALQSTYDAIKTKFQNGVKSIVLFIDEIHAISSTDIPKDRDDKLTAHDHLLQHITENSQERRLLMLFATSRKLDTIQETLLSRCTTIEVPHSSDQQRADILQACFSRYHKPRLVMNELDEVTHTLGASQKQATRAALMQKLDQPNVAFKVAQDQIVLAQTTNNSSTVLKYTLLNKKLAALEKEVAQFDVITNDKEARSSITKKAADLMCECDELYNQTKTTNAEHTTNSALHNAIATEYLNAVKAYVSQDKHPAFSEDQLAQLTKQTEGMSPRNLVALIDHIYTVATLENKGIVTDEIIQEELKKALTTVALEKSKETKEQADEAEKKWHKEMDRLHKVFGLKDLVRRTASEPHRVNAITFGAGGALGPVNLSGSMAIPRTGSLQYPKLADVLNEAQPNSDAAKARDVLSKDPALQKASTTKGILQKELVYTYMHEGIHPLVIDEQINPRLSLSELEHIRNILQRQKMIKSLLNPFGIPSPQGLLHHWWNPKAPSRYAQAEKYIQLINARIAQLKKEQAVTQ